MAPRFYEKYMTLCVDCNNIAASYYIDIAMYRTPGIFDERKI